MPVLIRDHRNVFVLFNCSFVLFEFQFYNHLTVPVDLYCTSEELKRCEAHDLQLHSGDSFTHITKVDAHTLTSVPLYVAYHCKIYVAPADGYVILCGGGGGGGEYGYENY